MFSQIGLSDQLHSTLEVAVEKRKRKEAKKERKDLVQLERDAEKLVQQVIKSAQRAASEARNCAIVGCKERKTRDLDHVPKAITRLQDLGLAVEQVPIAYPLKPIILFNTKQEWREKYRMVIVVTIK